MKKMSLTILLFALGFTLSYGQTTAISPAGTGIEADPYLIANLGNLSWLRQNPSKHDKYFKQTANIDASETATWDDADDNGDGDKYNDPNDLTATGTNEGWSPISTFEGTYDGDSHTIDGLTILRTEDYVGFIGTLLSGTVKALGVTSTNYEINGSQVGGLIGLCEGGTVDGCYSTGSIKENNVAGEYNYGGLIGEILSDAAIAHSTISNSYSEVNITDIGTAAAMDVGGFIGYVIGESATAITITDCYATGSAAGEYRVAGFSGYLKGNVKISKCYSIGDASSNDDDLGGFVGAMKAATDSPEITECYSKSNVFGSVENGGFVGYLSDGSIANCYSMGDVHANGDDCGGFAGEIDGGSVNNCYSTSQLIGTGNVNQGFCGDGSSLASCANNFWDTQASGQSDTDEGNGDDGATGKTTAEMKTAATFTGAGWDFVSTWEIVGSNYPRLQGQPDGALPVELTSFEAVVKDGSVLLTWSTSTEVNNYGFEVQSSKEKGQSWKTIGFVEGAGNSNSPKQYSYVVTNVSNSASYRLKQIDADGAVEYSDVVSVTVNGLAKTELYQNYPNPFNPTTQISFSLSALSNVKISVYSILGEKVAELANQKMEAGNHSINFDASNLTSGVYIYRIDTPSYTKTMKMMLMK